MECTKSKNWHFFGIGDTNSPYWSWMVATQVTDTPFGLAFRENLKKERASNFIYVKNDLPEQIHYNTQ